MLAGPARDARRPCSPCSWPARRGPAATPRAEILEALRQFQSDAATLLEAQVDRIEALNREIAALRDEVRGHRGPPPPAARSASTSRPGPPPESDESAAWLLDRLNGLEPESRSTWKDLLGRIASTVHPGPRPSPSGPPRPASKARTLAEIAPGSAPTTRHDGFVPLRSSRSRPWSDARPLPGPSCPVPSSETSRPRPTGRPPPGSVEAGRRRRVAGRLLTMFGTYLGQPSGPSDGPGPDRRRRP